MLAAMLRTLASSPRDGHEADAPAAPPWNRKATLTVAAGLLIVALVPRAVVAWKAAYLCPDGTYYVLLARTLSQGEFSLPLVPDLFNAFPQILRGLHALGLPWETGAKLWNVACGALVTLPLWGWQRRQFNEPIALCAAVLCAVHPKLIEWSGEVVREPTFWLCFVTALYAGWRGASESSPLWWSVAGLTAALASQTRMEGWLLLIPLGAWWLGRLWSPDAKRLRLAAGLLLCVAAYPAVVAPINLAVHQGSQPFQWGAGLHRLLYVSAWLDDSATKDQPAAATPAAEVPMPLSLLHADAADAASSGPRTPTDEVDKAAVVVVALKPALATPVATSQPPTSSASTESPAVVPAAAPVLPPMLVTAEASDTFTSRDAARIFLRALTRGLTPVYLALTIAGLAWGWRSALRWPNLPLLAVAMATLAAIWIHLAEAHLTSSRYWLLVVLTVSPWTARGLLEAARRLPWQPAVPVAAALAVLTIFGWGYAAALPVDAGRQAKAELGQWVAEHMGAGKRVVGTPRLKMMEYYAQATYQILPQPAADDPDWSLWIAGQQPDLVALSQKDLGPSAIERVEAQLRAVGWVTIAAESLPASCRETSVLLARSGGDSAVR